MLSLGCALLFKMMASGAVFAMDRILSYQFIMQALIQEDPDLQDSGSGIDLF